MADNLVLKIRKKNVEYFVVSYLRTRDLPFSFTKVITTIE
jgi:hypothetical protein